MANRQIAFRKGMSRRSTISRQVRRTCRTSPGDGSWHRTQEAPAIRPTRYLRRRRSGDDPFVKGGIFQRLLASTSAMRKQRAVRPLERGERYLGWAMSEHREQAIRERAYALWEQDGRPEGRSVAHWSQAEAEIGSEQPLVALDNTKRVKSRRGRSAPKSHSLAAASQLVQAP